MAEGYPRGTYTRDDLEKRLRTFEDSFGMDSREFFGKWERGDLPPRDEFLTWAALCGHLGVRELDPA